MNSRVASLLILAAVAGGCATAPDRARRTEVTAALDSAARQVRRCYRAPRASTLGRQIITQLTVRLNPDGELSGLPTLRQQTGVTPANRDYAGPMAEAAIAAVLRCTPLRLPPALYENGWSEFVLTFSPLAAA